MTWNYEKKKREWFDTEAGKLLKESDLQPRVCNVIMRHFIYQFNPHSGDAHVWTMCGQIWELEEIARGEKPIVGIGIVGQNELQKVLDDNKSTE